MRVLDLLIQKSVPQWSRCYYDYEGLKVLIRHVQNSLIIIQKMKDFQKRYHTNNFISQSEQTFNIISQQKQPFIGPFKQHYTAIIKSVNQANKLFFGYRLLCKNIVFLFLQMKVHEIDRRVDRYENWARKVQEQSKLAFAALLSNIFQQGKMIYRMCEVNIIAQKKIQKKHINNFEPFGLDSPMYQTTRVNRTMEELQTQFIRVQNLYLTVKQPYPKRARTQFYQQLQMTKQAQSLTNYFFGLGNGISLSLIVVSILIYGQSNLSSYDPKFTRDFPVWRAVGYVILYLWAISLDIVVFQKYKIDYQLIFGFKQMTPRSSLALSLSSGFTLIYMILFVFYLLDITQLIHTNSQIVYWFPLIMWGIMLGYLLNPLPIFNFNGRIFFFKQIILTIISPFTKILFNVIFITQQFASMLLPFSDFIYSFCYFLEQDLGNSNSQRCETSLHSAQYFGFCIFGYRIIQSLKIAWENKVFFGTRQMFIVLRASLNILILLVSLLSHYQKKFIIVWYVFALPTIAFNYYVDLKWDWGLLQANTTNKFLRNQVAFQGYEYYIIMLVNLTFRISALLTLSQNIIYELNLFPFYLIFIISIIEIIRRFFWNIIKVEREHVLNCQKFAVRTDYEQNQAIIINSLNQDDVHRKISQQDRKLEIIRVSEEIKNLNDHIQRKKVIRKQINRWHQLNKKLLQNIEKQIQQMYKSVSKQHRN